MFRPITCQGEHYVLDEKENLKMQVDAGRLGHPLHRHASTRMQPEVLLHQNIHISKSVGIIESTIDGDS